jgi:hypothetical protein
MVFGDQMRLSSLFYLGISALVVIACGEEEVKKAPKLKKAAKSLPKNGISEDPFQDMETLNTATQQANKIAAAEAPTTRLELSNNIPKPRQNGDYVLQAGVSDSKVLADILVNKIERLGYEAYIIKITDPAQLVGIFYRVRVGFFNTVTDARLFGHNVLKPEGIGFWIDNSKNDNLGTPVNSEVKPTEELKTTEQTPSASDWVEEPKAVTNSETAISPEPVNNSETVTSPEPVNDSETVTSPEPVNDSETVTSPEPVTNSETVTSPEPVNNSETVTSPEPVNNSETVTTPEPAKVPETPAVQPPGSSAPAVAPVVEKAENDTWDDTPAQTPTTAKKATHRCPRRG